MTLRELETDFRLMMLELEGSDGAEDPTTPRRLLLRATDWFAEQTDAFWYAFMDATTSGKTVYCAPMLYKVRALNYRGLDGMFTPISPNGPGAKEGYFVNQQNQRLGAITSPYRVTVQGMNRVVVTPPPIVPATLATGQVAPALEFEGYAIPSKCFKYDGVTPLFAAPDDECPLNAVCHPGILSKAMMLRIIQRPTPENMARRGMLAEEVDNYLRAFASHSFNYVPNYRFNQTRYRWI